MGWLGEGYLRKMVSNWRLNDAWVACTVLPPSCDLVNRRERKVSDDAHWGGGRIMGGAPVADCVFRDG